MTDTNERILFGEHTLPRFSDKRYFPVKIGQRLHERYSVITKLGYGAYSTVWLARDERTNTFASVKVYVQDDGAASSQVLNEVKLLDHIKTVPQDGYGSPMARLPLDHFELAGPTGRHHCLVLKPHGCSLWTLRHMFPDFRIPLELVRFFVRCLLACINWLHLDGDVFHTEITSQNVLMKAETDAQFTALEEAEKATPSVPVMVGDHPVYPSCGGFLDARDLTGFVQLTDFGSARRVSSTNKGWWMPDTYRAPEVLMGVEWSNAVDEWSIGIMALELIEGRNLFEPIDHEHKQYVLSVALAQYISVLGLPPLWMIQESENPAISTFFDSGGQWIGEVPIPEFSLEGWITALPPGEEKDSFLKFMRKILVWEPAKRGTSYDLLTDPWQSILEARATKQ